MGLTHRTFQVVRHHEFGDTTKILKGLHMGIDHMSELTEYGRQVRDGVIEDKTFHPTIFEAPVESDPWDEEECFKCNPALDDFRSLEEMRSFAEQAKRIPAREAVFRNLYLNQPIDGEARFVSAPETLAKAERQITEMLFGSAPVVSRGGMPHLST